MFNFSSSATATFMSARRMIFAAGFLLISEVALLQRANTSPQFFAFTSQQQMKRARAGSSDISNQAPARPLPESASRRRANDGSGDASALSNEDGRNEKI
jgi:hypothetical protein